MLAYLKIALIAGLTAIVSYGLSAFFRAGAPVSFSEKAGTIRPNRLSAWVIILVGASMMAGAAWLALSAEDWSALPLALLGIALAGFTAPSVTSIHSVSWDEIGIEGPSTTFGLTLGANRTSIPWEQIERTGKTATGYWFIQATDKKRIYWSYLYGGYGRLAEALQQRCPALSLPNDMI